MELEDLASIIPNLSEILPVDDSRTSTTPDIADDPRTITVRTSYEYPILAISTVDKPLNKFLKQIASRIDRRRRHKKETC